MTARLLYMLCLGSLLYGLSSCVSAKQLLDRGEYLRAYQESLRSLQLYQRPSPQRYLDLQRSYTLLEEEHSASLTSLYQSEAPDRWVFLARYYRATYERAVAVAPHLGESAIVAATGYAVADLRDLARRADQQASDYCIKQAQSYYAAAARGQHLAARTAYSWLQDALAYSIPQPDSIHRRADWLVEQGTLRILVEAPVGHPLLQAAHQVEDPPQTWEWTELVFVRQPGQRIDLVAQLVVDDVYCSWEEEDASSEIFTQEVLERVEIVTEEVQVGDSTVTVERTIEHYTTLEATVTTIEQSRWAKMQAAVTIWYDLPDSPPLAQWQQQDSDSWVNVYQTGSGDQGAMPMLYGSCEFYPSCDELLRTAGWGLYEAILHELPLRTASLAGGAVSGNN